MKKILVIGAGFSTRVLVEYLLKQAKKNNYQLVVADKDLEAAKKIIQNNELAEALHLDILNDTELDNVVREVDMVISMLPARFHILVARKCLKYNKNLATASYVSDEMAKLDNDAKSRGLVFLNEIGLDPGLDHMSAMQIISKLKKQGAKITAFRSYTGGLVAPEYDNNPWHYKFTWNPRNVVLAGQGTAKFLRNGHYKYIPYHKLFTRIDSISIEDYGDFEGYANRDSLKYRYAYGLDNILTMLRGTLRRPGYTEAWNALVQLGMTDDTFILENSENLTYRQFTNSFLPYHKTKTVEQKICEYLNISCESEIFKKLQWLDLFSDDKKINLKDASAAQILQKILVEKWTLDDGDKDMIVMQHIFDYTLNGKDYKLYSSLVVEGRDSYHTAMAITVGTPLAIGVKLIMNNKINLKGVHIPVHAEIYEPVMEELKEHGIVFKEKIIEV